MRYARIYPWRRTRRFRAPSNGPEAFFVAQFSAGYTTNMFGLDLRQAQLVTSRRSATLDNPNSQKFRFYTAAAALARPDASMGSEVAWTIASKVAPNDPLATSALVALSTDFAASVPSRVSRIRVPSVLLLSPRKVC